MYKKLSGAQRRKLEKKDEKQQQLKKKKFQDYVYCFNQFHRLRLFPRHSVTVTMIILI